MDLKTLIGSTATSAGAVAGYWRSVPEWSLGGNDRYGDCTFVSLCNFIDLLTAVNGAPQLVTEAEAEFFYAVEAGFNPNDPATDHGEVLENVIRHWRDQGWPADPTDRLTDYCEIPSSQIHQAVHSLGAVPVWALLPQDDIGWDFSDAAMGVVAGTGPHAFLIVGSDPDGYDIVTWAEHKRISRAWFAVYGRQAFAIRHPAWRVP